MFSFQQLNVGYGFFVLEVYQLYQDKKGYVWVFIEYGMVRYNGICFVFVCINFLFNVCIIYCVVELWEGIMYIVNFRVQIFQVVGDCVKLLVGLGKIFVEIMVDNQIIFDMFVDDLLNIWFFIGKKSYIYFFEIRKIILLYIQF